MDETYIKVKGKWGYLYRAVDKEGNTVDFMLSEHLDEPEARAFFEKVMGSIGKVTMDKSGANKAGMDTIHLRLALLFYDGRCVSADATWSGIELHHMLTAYPIR